jgi:hypothetical protein
MVGTIEKAVEKGRTLAGEEEQPAPQGEEAEAEAAAA